MVITENGFALTAGEYPLNNPPHFASEYFDGETQCRYESTEFASGNLIITRFDKVNFIISGRFELRATHNGCDDIVITDGRFDIKYIP
ncbi:MAG: hypothetical protein ACOYXA_11125 [Bacteroidota bacterium]